MLALYVVGSLINQPPLGTAGIGSRPARCAPGFEPLLELDLGVGVAFVLVKVVLTLSRSTIGRIEVGRVEVEQFHCCSYPSTVSLYPAPIFQIYLFVFPTASIAI